MAEKSHSFAGKRLRHLSQYTTSHLSFRERPVAAVLGCFLLLTVLAPTSGAADVDAVTVQRSIIVELPIFAKRRTGVAVGMNTPDNRVENRHFAHSPC